MLSRDTVSGWFYNTIRLYNPKDLDGDDTDAVVRNLGDGLDDEECPEKVCTLYSTLPKPTYLNKQRLLHEICELSFPFIKITHQDQRKNSFVCVYFPFSQDIKVLSWNIQFPAVLCFQYFNISV